LGLRAQPVGAPWPGGGRCALAGGVGGAGWNEVGRVVWGKLWGRPGLRSSLPALIADWQDLDDEDTAHYRLVVAARCRLAVWPWPLAALPTWGAQA